MAQKWPSGGQGGSGGGAKKREGRRAHGPGVPVRGKEFLLETPGSRLAIAKHHHTNNHPAIKYKAKPLKPQRPT